MAERRPLVMIGGSLRELPDGDSIAMTRVWQSGMTVAQGEKVISPSDWDEYRRTAATGGGTTDPADDIANYNALTYTRITGIGASASFSNNGSIGAANFANGATRVSTGAIVAGVRTEILNASGRGVLGYLGFTKASSGGGRFEVLVDGRAVFDASIQAVSTDCNVLIGSMGSGAATGSTIYPAYVAVPMDMGVQFRRSLRIWYTPATNPAVANTTLAYILRPVR